jgi:hypothetical protein
MFARGITRSVAQGARSSALASRQGAKRNMGGHHEIPTEGIDGAIRKVFPKDWQVGLLSWVWVLLLYIPFGVGIRMHFCIIYSFF